MKKFILVLSICISSLLATAQTNSKQFFYESISNSSKSIDYLIGVYPSTYSFSASGNDGQGMSTLKMALINKANESYSWKNYRVLLLLANGKMIANYTTKAEDGDYNCTYDVAAGKTHYQYLCFSQQFAVEDIKRVFIVVKDNVFELLLSDAK